MRCSSGLSVLSLIQSPSTARRPSCRGISHCACKQEGHPIPRRPSLSLRNLPTRPTEKRGVLIPGTPNGSGRATHPRQATHSHNDVSRTPPSSSSAAPTRACSASTCSGSPGPVPSHQQLSRRALLPLGQPPTHINAAAGYSGTTYGADPLPVALQHPPVRVIPVHS